MPPTEKIAADEETRFEGYAEELRTMQRAAAAEDKLGRALHKKAHVGALAELEVKPGLPPALAVSLFGSATKHRAYVRYSSGSGHRQADGTADVRGLALKICGVPGRKLIPGLEDKQTQDFLLIQTPQVAFRGPEEFMTFVRVAAKGKALLLPRLVLALGLGRTLEVLKRLAKLPQPPSLAASNFYTALPLRFGSGAAKLALFPVGASPEGRGSGAQALRDDLVARLAEGALTYRLCVQLFVDDQTTPIEDSSVPWPEEKSPWVDVATLTIEKLDLRSERGQKLESYVESLSFDPWHATDELRPLGAMMRARKHAYKASVIERKAAAEPDGSEVF